MTHRFVYYTDDDLMCAGCDVIVADDAAQAVTIPCPAPSCTDPGNDSGCVIVAAEYGTAECAYCGASASVEDVEEDADAPPAVL